MVYVSENVAAIAARANLEEVPGPVEVDLMWASTVRGSHSAAATSSNRIAELDFRGQLVESNLRIRREQIRSCLLMPQEGSIIAAYY